MGKINPKTKNKGSLKKVFRILFLLAIREGYLSLRNIYGLVCHPFFTLSQVFKKKDLSQGVFLFGLPGWFWLGTIFFLAVIRFFLGIRGNLGWIALTSLLAVSLFSGLFLAYLLYWFLRIFAGFNKGGE